MSEHRNLLRHTKGLRRGTHTWLDLPRLSG